ncbi:MAG: hypothetical protein D6808_02675, partial [Candidatus Dadabacteria bacterium]
MTEYNPRKVALKSFFLGPQAENSPWVKDLERLIFDGWFGWRKGDHPEDGCAITEEEQKTPEFRKKTEEIKLHLEDLINRFQNEVPSFSPRYIGHMVSEISIPALLGYITTILYNPNNISEEVSRVGMKIEREAICDLMIMLGVNPEKARGHFTSGGTVANIEGLVRARARLARWIAAGLVAGRGEYKTLSEAAHQGWERYDSVVAEKGEEAIRKMHFLHSNPYGVAKEIEKRFGISYMGPVVLAPETKHYSWPKGILLLGLGADAFWPISLDKYGKLSIPDLKRQTDKALKENRPIVMAGGVDSQASPMPSPSVSVWVGLG